MSKPCKHVEGPEGYAAHMVWLERMSKRYEQQKCPKCGLYKIWKLRASQRGAVQKGESE